MPIEDALLRSVKVIVERALAERRRDAPDRIEVDRLVEDALSQVGAAIAIRPYEKLLRERLRSHVRELLGGG